MATTGSIWKQPRKRRSRHCVNWRGAMCWLCLGERRETGFMERAIAKQQNNSDHVAGIADALVHRINHSDFPANCRRVDEQISQSTGVFDFAAANLLEVLGDCQLL